VLRQNHQKINEIKKSLFLILGIILILGGCSFNPDYKTPDASIPSGMPFGKTCLESMSKMPETRVEDIPWRKFITDQGLQNVIEAALDHNSDLLIAALNLQRARAIYGIRRADLFPALNVDAGGSKKRIPKNLSSDQQNREREVEQYDVNLGVLSWEIDFFGRIRSLKERALHEYMATEQAHRSAQILIVYEVSKAYLALAADKDNLNLAKTTFETQKKTFDLIKRRFKVGIATDLDFQRARTQMEGARRDVARFMQLLAQDQNTLDLLTGYKFPDDKDVSPDSLGDIEAFKDFFAGVSSEILLKRPDVLQAESILKAAYTNIGAARAALFPRISLTTSVGTASDELSGLFKAGSDTWNFASRIIMPVFDARLWSAVDVTKAEKEIALVQYEKALQTAFREVADSLAVSASVEEQLSAQQSLVDATAKTYRLSNVRYKKGIDSYLGVLDAQRTLYESQRVLVAISLAKRINEVRFYTVLGGGVDYDIQ
jgi:multidrug efflux system outer membrane protein